MSAPLAVGKLSALQHDVLSDILEVFDTYAADNLKQIVAGLIYLLEPNSRKQ